MGSNKTEQDKKMLASAHKKNKRVPVWVMQKTNREVSQNPKQYHWRRKKVMEGIKSKKKASEGK